MSKKRYLMILSAAIVSVLLGSLFYYSMVQAQYVVGEYDPWIDINDDGKIDGQDLFYPSRAFGTYGTPINKTELLLELLERVELLENKTISEGYIGPPAYDSGWMNLSKEQGSHEIVFFEHNLNTTDLLVYVVGKDEAGFIHHEFYGADVTTWTVGNETHSLERGLFWVVDANSGFVDRVANDYSWDFVRVMIWKISELPT